MEIIKEIRDLEEKGVLGPEECPERNYWHWQVLDRKKLTYRLRSIYNLYGEIRWYGGYDS
jgi:hypothetical protein